MNRRRDPGRYTDTERSATFEARFWKYVDRRGPDECWPWTAHLTSKGYGELFYGLHPVLRSPVNIQAHQAAWLIAGRTLPTWPNVLDHTCRNRTCANVAHLRMVTQGTNTVENSNSCWAKNKLKTHCVRCGNPYAGANLAIFKKYNPKRGRWYESRQCLTCWPRFWRHAVIPRDPPPGAESKPRKRKYEQFMESASK